eukprot:366466-Chlamydomonas_euryale.AAC.3
MHLLKCGTPPRMRMLKCDTPLHMHALQVGAWLRMHMPKCDTPLRIRMHVHKCGTVSRMRVLMWRPSAYAHAEVCHTAAHAHACAKVQHACAQKRAEVWRPSDHAARCSLSLGRMPPDAAANAAAHAAAQCSLQQICMPPSAASTAAANAAALCSLARYSEATALSAAVLGDPTTAGAAPAAPPPQLRPSMALRRAPSSSMAPDWWAPRFGEGVDVLCVNVHEARDLPVTDLDAQSTSSYVKLAIGDAAPARTRVCHRNRHPLWEQCFFFDLAGLAPDSRVSVSVHGRGRMRTEHFCGAVLTTLSHLLSPVTDVVEPVDSWYRWVEGCQGLKFGASSYGKLRLMAA